MWARSGRLGSHLGWRLVPEVDDGGAGDDECASEQDAGSWRCAEKEEIDELKRDEERGHVNAGRLGELDRGEIEESAIGGEEGCGAREQGEAARQRMVVQGDSHECVADGFKDGGGDDECEDFHIEKMVAEVSAGINRFRMDSNGRADTGRGLEESLIDWGGPVIISATNFMAEWNCRCSPTLTASRTSNELPAKSNF